MTRAWCLAVLLAGCGSTSAPAQPARVTTRVLYGPAHSTKLTPFPSNRYARVDASSPTGLRVALSAETTADAILAQYPLLTEQLNELDGFSVIGGISVHFSGAIDPASIDAKIEDYRAGRASMRLVDVDPRSPERGTSRGLVVRYYEDEDYVLVAQPAVPLRPKTTYLFVVTDDVRDASGARVGPSDDMTHLLERAQSGAYERSVADALEPLFESKMLAREHIALATLFTTESVHDQTFAMASSLRASAPPSLQGEVTLDKTSETDGRIAFRGRFTAPEWRSETDGRFHFDDAGAPIVQKEASLEFRMVFSDRSVGGPRPVVVFGHGLTSSKEVVWEVASWLADLGAVVVGIDAPEHGSRKTATEKAEMFDTAFKFFSVDVASKTFNLARGRDNFRQMSSDQLQLVRALRGALSKLDVLPVGAPDGVPDLDPERMAYMGESFGSILAPAVLALAPELRGAVLQVAGGGLTTIVSNSPAFKIIVPALFHAGTPEGDRARIFSMGQALYDAGDPLNYAGFVTLAAPPGRVGWSPRSVLVNEVIDDALVPNVSTSFLARTFGLTHVSPTIAEIDGVPVSPAPFSANLGGGATGGVFQFDRADGKVAEHNTLAKSAEARAQYVPFLGAVLNGAPCVIRDPLEGAP